MRCAVIGWYVQIKPILLSVILLDIAVSCYVRTIADGIFQCDALNEHFDLDTQDGSIDTHAYLKRTSSTLTTDRKPIFSFTPPAVCPPDSPSATVTELIEALL